MISSFCWAEEIKEVTIETEEKSSSDPEFNSQGLVQNRRIFNIGAVLSTGESIVHFLQVRYRLQPLQ